MPQGKTALVKSLNSKSAIQKKQKNQKLQARKAAKAAKKGGRPPPVCVGLCGSCTAL